MALDDALAQQTAETAKGKLGKIADLLERNGIDLDEVGSVKRVSLYQNLTKDEDGNAEIHDLVAIQLSPKWAEGPAWPVVAPAKPTLVRPAKARPVSRSPLPGWQRALILPDPQFGYWRHVDTDTLDPFHSEPALAVAVELAAASRPDLIVLLGDVLDLPEQSRFEIEPAFSYTTQEALDRCHRWLAELRAAAGDDCRMVYIEGNHDRRLRKNIVANAKAAFGLRQAATTPDTWPVMSIPHLLRLEDLSIEYVDAYPAGIFWINDNLACVHGEKLKVSQVIEDERVSIIQGHVHRIATQYKTRRVRDGAKTSVAVSAGCLCRIDGAVPSVKGSTDSFGRPVKRPEDWQNAVVVVDFEPGEGRFAVEVVPIFEGWAMWRGLTYGTEQ